MKGLAWFIRFVIDDIKTTFKTLWAMIRGKAKPRYSSEELLSINWQEMIREYWPLFVFMAIAFSLGYIYAAKVYQHRCNQALWDFAASQMQQRGLNWTYLKTFNITGLNIS